MSEDVKRMGRELAYQGTVLKVYKDHMKFSNGNTEDWDFIHHDGAAAVIPVMDDGKISAIGTHEELMERDTLEIPAGKLDDPDEEGIVCASRELKEETGYSSDDLEWLLTIRTTVAFCNERIEVFVARNLIPGEQHLDEDEFVDVKAYKLEELKEMIFEGKIQDSKTMAAILAYESKYLHGQNA